MSTKAGQLQSRFVLYLVALGAGHDSGLMHDERPALTGTIRKELQVRSQRGLASESTGRHTRASLCADGIRTCTPLPIAHDEALSVGSRVEGELATKADRRVTSDRQAETAAIAG